MKKVETNLNLRIWFKLNEEGEKILRNYTSVSSSLRKDEDGYYCLQIWEFTKVFGEHFKFGFGQPVETTEVTIETYD